MRKYLLISVIVCSFCTGKDVEQIRVENIPEVVPKEIKKFNSVGEFYYSYLGISSFGLANGEVILVPWDPAQLVRFNPQNKTILSTTTMGQGPGELTDAGVPVMGVDSLIGVYDQMQAKLLFFNSKLDLDFEQVIESNEGMVPSGGGFFMGNGKLLLKMRSNNFRQEGKDRSGLLIQYDVETHQFGRQMITKSKRYAPIGEVLNGRSGSYSMVAFTDNQLFSMHPKRESLFIFDTATDVIAEISYELDTLSTIAVHLPQESLKQADIDSLYSLYEDDLEYIIPYLPSVKAVADEMMVFNDQIWLKTNLRGNSDFWFVLDLKGNLKAKVCLPKNSHLTHISEHHLGVRLNEIDFALYEPVNF